MISHVSLNIKPQAVAVLRLDAEDSSGAATAPISVFPARLMALALHPQPIWFGFVVIESGSPITPGVVTRVPIAFLDEEGAQKTFHAGASVLFGDGVRTRGTLAIDEYLRG